jgi:serine/threonine protein kinase
MIKKMLNPNPRERITIAEIRKHPWINEGYDHPPMSLLTVRQPVLEVRDEIIEQLMSLGFKNEEEIRKQILDNECCQVCSSPLLFFILLFCYFLFFYFLFFYFFFHFFIFFIFVFQIWFLESSVD